MDGTRSSRLGAVIALAVTSLGCAEAPFVAPAVDAESGLPFVGVANVRAPDAAAEETPRIVAREAEAPRGLALEGSCAHGLRIAAVGSGPIAREFLERLLRDASKPLGVAVCACLAKPTSLRVSLVPEYGQIEASTGDARDDACLADKLGRDRYVRAHLGSDCIGCGARRFPLWHDARPVDLDEADEEASTLLVQVRFEP